MLLIGQLVWFEVSKLGSVRLYRGEDRSDGPTYIRKESLPPGVEVRLAGERIHHLHIYFSVDLLTALEVYTGIEMIEGEILQFRPCISVPLFCWRACC